MESGRHGDVRVEGIRGEATKEQRVTPATASRGRRHTARCTGQGQGEGACWMA
jgi:hypothetical protein